MKHHCIDKDGKRLSTHKTLELAVSARDVWNHTRELVWIENEFGRLLTAAEVYKIKAALWIKGGAL